MRILVVGAGATGGYFGARLAAAGRDVTFLVRPARKAEIDARGLAVVSPDGDLALRPRLVTAPDIPGPFDLVLLTVKAPALAAAVDDIGPAMGRDTVLLPVLNGFRHIDVLTARFGGQVVGGVCRVAAALDDAGRILHLAPGADLALGELGGGVSPRVAAIDAALRGCGFAVRTVPDIRQTLWDKWTMLAALGALTCLLRGTVGEVAAAPGGPELAAALVEEVAAVAAASGHPPARAYRDATAAMLATPRSPMTSSLYRDLEAGRPAEADHVLGDLVDRARALGVPTPLLLAARAAIAVRTGRGRGPAAAQAASSRP